ncbi:MAG: hypothetical protein AAB898_00795 [Patescibacteria group bacterium]
MVALITIEHVYARAGRPMRPTRSRVETGVVVGWQAFYALRIERAWLRERKLSGDDLVRYRALPLKSRAAVRRVAEAVLLALGSHVTSFAPEKVARVRDYWQRQVLPECRWVELFHRLMDAEVLHLDMKSIRGALCAEERAFRVRLLNAREQWLRALQTPRVNVHELHATLTVASLVLLHEVGRAVSRPHAPRHDAVLE